MSHVSLLEGSSLPIKIMEIENYAHPGRGNEANLEIIVLIFHPSLFFFFRYVCVCLSQPWIVALSGVKLKPRSNQHKAKICISLEAP